MWAPVAVDYTPMGTIGTWPARRLEVPSHPLVEDFALFVVWSMPLRSQILKRLPGLDDMPQRLRLCGRLGPGSRPSWESSVLAVLRVPTSLPCSRSDYFIAAGINPTVGLPKTQGPASTALCYIDCRVVAGARDVGTTRQSGAVEDNAVA